MNGLEKIYFQDRLVTVSNMRLTVYGRTYPLNNINSAVIREVKPYRNVGVGLCAASAAFGLIFLGAKAALGLSASVLGSYLLGCLIFFTFGFVLRYYPTNYALTLGATGRIENVMESKDQQYIAAIIEAINAARVGA